MKIFLVLDLKGNKVLVIGLDSGRLDFVRDWAEEGYLPNLRRIINNGVSGVLMSTYPPITIPAWITFATGKNPAKIGVYGFRTPKPNSYEYDWVKYDAVKDKRIWDIASDHGRKVGLVHVPLTYPPQKVNGFMVSAFFTPKNADVFTYPPELSEEIKRLGYRIGIYYGPPGYDFIGDYLPPISDEEFLEDITDVLERRAFVVTYLMEKYDWDLFIVNYNTLDNLQHWFWRYIDPKHPAYYSKEAKKFKNTIKEFYKRLDSIIGKMLALTDEETIVIVFSDHGMGPKPKKCFYVNQWLRDIGMMKIEKRVEVSGSELPYDKDKGILPDPNCPCGNWNNVKAYWSGIGIVINVKGRQPKGTVNPGKEYEKVRNLIIHKIQKVRDPDTNKKVVRYAYRREEVYSGPYIDLAPDILLELDQEYACNESMEHETIFGPNKVERLSGVHKREGLLLMMGPGIGKGVTLEKEAQMVDLAPTILSILGIPVPSDMDGKVVSTYKTIRGKARSV